MTLPGLRGAAPGMAPAASRRRPRTAPVKGERSSEMHSEEAINAVVQSQKAAQARLLNQIMVHEAWVHSKREAASGSGGGAKAPAPPDSPNRVITGSFQAPRGSRGSRI